MLTSLAILGDTSLELTSAGGNDENGAISLGSTSDHVLDEVTMTGGICSNVSNERSDEKGIVKKLTDDGDIVLGGLELPESDIDGDTTLTLGLQLVKNPRVLEGALSELGGLLLELLDGTLVDTTALF